MNNPLLEDYEPPLLDRISSVDVLLVLEALLSDCCEIVASIIDNGRTAWETLVASLARAQDHLNKAWSSASYLNAVTNTDTLHEVSNVFLPLINAYNTEVV